MSAPMYNCNIFRKQQNFRLTGEILEFKSGVYDKNKNNSEI